MSWPGGHETPCLPSVPSRRFPTRRGTQASEPPTSAGYAWKTEGGRDGSRTSVWDGIDVGIPREQAAVASQAGKHLTAIVRHKIAWPAARRFYAVLEPCLAQEGVGQDGCRQWLASSAARTIRSAPVFGRSSLRRATRRFDAKRPRPSLSPGRPPVAG